MFKKNHNLPIKIRFIKPNEMWSHYSKDTHTRVSIMLFLFWNRGHAFKSVTLASPHHRRCSAAVTAVVLFQMKIRHNSVFLLLIVFCSVDLKPEIWFILFFQWIVRMVSDGSSSSSSISIDDWDDDESDDDAAMATRRGAMISLSGVCWKSNIKWE